MPASLVRTCAVLALLLPALALPAQQAAAPANSSISGKVFCADTNAPARLGQVFLRSTTPSDAGQQMMKGLEALRRMGEGAAQKLTPEQQAEQKRQTAEMVRTANMMSDTGHTVPIALDGTYRFTNVPPGTYQVRAVLDGYIDPLAGFSPEDLASQDPAMVKRIAAAAPTVTIAGNAALHVDLKLQRGAAISGRVLFDDGSPAIGWQVLAANPPVKTGSSSAENPFPAGLASFLHIPGTTDDTGHFRLAGLPAGVYLLQARKNILGMGRGGFAPISSGAGIGGASLAALMGDRLAIYSGNAWHASQAVPVSVRIGDDHAGVEIVIPLHALHAVSGSVLSKSDGHPVNFGSVELTDSSDSSLTFTASVQDDGSFRFDYVPGGSSYTLSTHNIEDTITTGTSTMLTTTIAKKKTIHNYDPASQPLQVSNSDIDNLRLNVVQSNWTPAAGKSDDCKCDDLLKTLTGGDGEDNKPKPAAAQQ